MIIMLTGYKRSGKDTAGSIMKKYLEDNGYKVTMLKFAGKLYEEVSNITNVSVEELEIVKDEPIPGSDLTYRDLMKAIGAYRREKDNKYYIKHVVKEILSKIDDKKQVFIITDLRFIDEYKEIKDTFDHTYVVRLYRYNAIQDTTENQIDCMPRKYVIHNNNSMYGLEYDTIDLIKRIKEDYENNKKECK